jgi:hypothetical protein
VFTAINQDHRYPVGVFVRRRSIGIDVNQPERESELREGELSADTPECRFGIGTQMTPGPGDEAYLDGQTTTSSGVTRPAGSVGREPNGLLHAHTRGAYFLLRRWTRVFLSSLRCFFLAIRLRRFLMTEPITRPR